MNGFLLYEGPSMLDGQKIICVVTDPDQVRLNKKTQRVIQTYILRADIDPIEAIRSEADISICGNCLHRGADGTRSCYVQVWSAPRNIFLAYQRGKYKFLPKAISAMLVCNEVVRLGAYGDPAAVPIEVWMHFLQAAKPIGYTHQWQDPRFADLKRWCMASCESEDDMISARLEGWRTFRVRSANDPVLRSEVICPASFEAGKKSHCAECLACGGLSAKARCDITIIAHGDKGKVLAFERKKVRP